MDKKTTPTPASYTPSASPPWGEHKTERPEAFRELAQAADPTAQDEAAVADLLKRLATGKAAAGAPVLRPDLNGLRVKSPAAPHIYLVDNGMRRWIPNPATYNNLFRDWSGVIVDIGVVDILQGPSISDGAVLARPTGLAPVYLVDGGHKRWIMSPAAMDRYHFAWQKIFVVPPILLNSIPGAMVIS